MASILEVYKNRKEDYLIGVYYERKPVMATDRGTRFGYSIVQDKDSHITDLLDNLETAETLLTIKTDDKIPIPDEHKTPFGYVVTDDGDLWLVQSCVTNIIKEHQNQVLRYRKKALLETKYLRLIRISNKEGIR